MKQKEIEFRSFVKNFKLANSLVLAIPDFYYSDFFKETELAKLLNELKKIHELINIFDRKNINLIVGSKALKNEQEAKQLKILLVLISSPELSKASDFFLFMTNKKSLLVAEFVPDISFFTDSLKKGQTFINDVVIESGKDILNTINNPLRTVFKWNGTYLIIGLLGLKILFKKV